LVVFQKQLFGGFLKGIVVGSVPIIFFPFYFQLTRADKFSVPFLFGN